MKRGLAALPLIALVATLLVGCGAKSPDHPEELKILVMKFLREVELKDFNGATTRVHPERRGDFVRWLAEGGDKTSFTNCEIRSLPTEDELDAIPEDKPRKAHVIVTIEYFRLPSTEVKREVRTQEWLFDEDLGRWFLMSGWDK